MIAQRSADLSGRVLAGRYRVERLLGEGGMGAVYEAVQLDLGRRVALKVLLGTPSGDALRRFRHEAEAAARLGHAHIVQVTDFQHVPGEPPFLVMELLAGRSLRHVLAAEGGLDWRRSARIGMQLLDALGAAHAAHIVHRDVKPENVFVVESRAVQDMVKVLDFGIAKLAEPLTSSGPLTAAGMAIGTPAYMAPEQALGEAVDARADLYAVAVVLFEATAGRRPIDVDPSMRLAAAVCAPPARLEDFVRDVDPRFAATVARALAKDPRERYASAAEMASAIAATLGDGGALETTRDGVPPTIRDAGAATTASIAGSTRGATVPTALPLAPPPAAPPLAAGTLASPAGKTGPSSRAPRVAMAAVGALALVAVGGGAYAVATGRVPFLRGEAPSASVSAPAPSASASGQLPPAVLLFPGHNSTVWLGESFTCRFEPYPGAVTYHCQLAQSSSKGVYCVGTTPELPCKVDVDRLRPSYATLYAFVVVGNRRTKDSGGYNIYVGPPR